MERLRSQLRALDEEPTLGALAPALLRVLALPLTAAGLVTVLFASFSGLAAWRDGTSEPDTLKGRPFEPRHALMFAALVAAILLMSALLAQWFGDYGALAAAAAAGFADAHAAAASVAQVFVADRISLTTAEFGVLVGVITNTISKTIVAWVSGGRSFALHLLPGLIAMLTAFAATIWLL